MRIVFLGEGNDCRTLLAEAIFNHLAPPGCMAWRASCDPACPPDAAALTLLVQQGIQPGPTAAGSPQATAPSLEHEILITVCPVRAEQICAHCGPNTLRAHWDVLKPERHRMRSNQRHTALLDTYHILRARIERLLVLVQAGAEKDRARFQHELARIGNYLP